MCYTSHTEDFVKEFYIKMGIFEPQQLDFRTVAKKLGITVFWWSRPSQALFLDDFAYVFLDERLSEQQQWQDFCHELCHVLLHVGDQDRMSESFRQYQEFKANHFMYHACVPTFMLKKINHKNLTAEYISTVFNVDKDFAQKRLDQYIGNHLNMTLWNFQTQ